MSLILNQENINVDDLNKKPRVVAPGYNEFSMECDSKPIIENSEFTCNPGISMTQGYFLTSRQLILSHPAVIGASDKAFRLLVIILLKASYTHQIMNDHGVMVQIAPGDYLCTTRQLAEDLKGTQTSIRRFLKKFCDAKILAQKVAHTKLIITIIDPETYDLIHNEDGSRNGARVAQDRLKNGSQINKVIKQESKKEDLSKKKDVYVPTADAARLAQAFHAEILKWNPTFKQPNLAAWAKQIDLMVTRDNRTVQQIETLMAWLPSNHFWRKNVLSTAKFREQFDRLQTEMQTKSESDWFRENLKTIVAWKKQYFDVLKHMQIKGQYVVNTKNVKELHLNMNPAALKVQFAHVAGVDLV